MFEMGDIHKFTDRFVVGSPNILARRPLRCDDNYFAGSYDTQDPLSTTNLNLQVRIYKNGSSSEAKLLSLLFFIIDTLPI